MPVAKSIFLQEFNSENPAYKPKFKRVGEPKHLEDQVIFGVLTARNYSGMIPPVQICDQNHDGEHLFWDYHFGEDKNESSPDKAAALDRELSRNY